MKIIKTKPKAKPKLVPVVAKAFTSIRPPVMGASPAGWHSIETKLHCDKKFQLASVWKVRLPQYVTPDALAVGGLFHAGRAHLFTSNFPMGADYQRQLHAYIEDAALRRARPVRDDAISRTKSYIDQYASYWGARMKPEVVGVEYELKGAMLPGMERTARLDDVSRYPENGMKLSIGECKTTSVSVADVVAEYTLHGQTTKQALLWESSPEGERRHGEVEDIMLDVVVKGYGKEKCTFGRVPIRIPDFVKNWYLPMLSKHVQEADAMTVDTRVVRNITSCTRLIGRMRVKCPYTELCMRGKAAASMFVDADGQSLATKKYTSEARPWD